MPTKTKRPPSSAPPTRPKLAPPDQLAREIQAVLTDELILPRYRSEKKRSRFDGHAYAASEAYFHLAREDGRLLRPVRRAAGDDVHWWLVEGDRVIDLTLGPRERRPAFPYEEGKPCAFRGGYRRPSKRAAEIIRRVRERRAAAG